MTNGRRYGGQSYHFDNMYFGTTELPLMTVIMATKMRSKTLDDGHEPEVHMENQIAAADIIGLC